MPNEGISTLKKKIKNEVRGKRMWKKWGRQRKGISYSSSIIHTSNVKISFLIKGLSPWNTWLDYFTHYWMYCTSCYAYPLSFISIIIQKLDFHYKGMYLGKGNKFWKWLMYWEFLWNVYSYLKNKYWLHCLLGFLNAKLSLKNAKMSYVALRPL